MIDHVEIVVRAGDGGDGAVSFRREKFVPFGGPDGGDGGKGGDVIIKTDPSVNTLEEFAHKKVFRAGRGGNGSGKKKRGKDGEDRVLLVPPGTVVSHKLAEETVVLADMEGAGESFVVARGGRGGRGNTHFTSATNQAPRVAERGEPGEEKALVLELRLIADVGIIGYPNVGKSTLLAAASAAHPKIASYPFTTLEPVLGVVQADSEGFVLAEIPGLVEDAHLGRGLGHDFLRHALRTRIFIHLVDGTATSPVDDMIRVNNELSLFDPSLSNKPQILAVNKIDLPEVKARESEITEAFREAGIKAHFISAQAGKGVSQLMAEVARMLKGITSRPEITPAPPKVFRPEPKLRRVNVHKEGDTFVIESPRLERLMAGPGLGSAELRWQVRRQLLRGPVRQTLEKAGIKPGDKVRVGSIEFEW